jgi:hypothetical protein
MHATSGGGGGGGVCVWVKKKTIALLRNFHHVFLFVFHFFAFHVTM